MDDGDESNYKILAFLTILFVNAFTFLELTSSHNIYINVQTQPSRVVSEHFLSVGIDTSEIYRGIDNLHLDSPKLLHMMNLLGPAYLRIGGTMSDCLIFAPNKTSSLNRQDPHTLKDKLPIFRMTEDEWIKLHKFTKKTNSRMLFDLNLLYRKNNSWDPSNAEELFKFSVLKNFDLDWQLGNEPNSFPHVFNVSILPSDLSKDYAKLRNIMKKYFPNSLLVGPDTTRPQPLRPSCVKYMKDFLKSGASYIDAISWHQYYLNGHIAQLNDFWEPDTMDLLQQQINTMLKNIKPYKKNLDMWLTETSSAYGGGAPGLSNSFAGSPLWLDKLGVAAMNGIQVVVRQSLLGGNYSLIDKDLNPLPDWWISVIYRILVGRKVLSCLTSTSRYQRLFCHCTNENYTSEPSVVIYGSNLINDNVTYFLRGNSLSVPVKVHEFVVTPTGNNRKSKLVFLNRKLLTYKSIIKIVPNDLGLVSSFTMPPYSIGFWVVHDVNISFCGKQTKANN